MATFSLEFPGGTPRELVQAIEKAQGEPLNAIIPEEFAQTQIPAIKVQNVNAGQLFQALSRASQKRVVVSSDSTNRTEFTGFGFEPGNSDLSDHTIWIFHAYKPVAPSPSPPRKFCRFYSLAPYLERGVTLDDITTAAKTGWAMLGETSEPEISYHKDTKLLIVVGDRDKLAVIDEVLSALRAAKPEPAAKPKADEKR